jgi:hypothetical protein
MSAGRLEECDNTSSQFVQLFDLWMQDICMYNSSPAGEIFGDEGGNELTECGKMYVHIWAGGVIVGGCKAASAVAKQCRQQNSQGKHSFH